MRDFKAGASASLNKTITDTCPIVTELGLGRGATRDELEDAIEGHAFEEAELKGTYTKAHI